MRILTVRQPWAWAIIHGGKDVENRVRNIAGDYRGPVAIHAAQQVDLAAFSGQSAPLTEAVQLYNEANTDVLKSSPWQTRGLILGVVNLTGVHRAYASFGCSIDEADVCEPPCSRWGEFDRGQTMFHLVLANPRPLASPIPYKGALGLRRLDDDTVTRVLEQIGDHHA